MSEILVVGGQIRITHLSNKVDEKQYSIRKINIWLHMLNDGMKPKRWLKPNSKGTKVNFESISSQEEYDKGLDELIVFINEVNRNFGLDIKLKRE